MNQPDLTFRNISEKRVEEKNLCEFTSNLPLLVMDGPILTRKLACDYRQDLHDRDRRAQSVL